jgi:hypothetical protein
VGQTFVRGRAGVLHGDAQALCEAESSESEEQLASVRCTVMHERLAKPEGADGTWRSLKQVAR